MVQYTFQDTTENIVVPHSLIQRWLALLYYLYYLRLAALSKSVWNDYKKAA